MMLPLVEQAGRSIEVDAPEPVTVRGRADDLSDMLRNLIDNALVHGRGLIRVRVAAEGSAAILEVSDEGPGLPEGLKASLFARFGKGVATSPGAGLGLAAPLPTPSTISKGTGGTSRVGPGRSLTQSHRDADPTWSAAMASRMPWATIGGVAASPCQPGRDPRGGAPRHPRHRQAGRRRLVLPDPLGPSTATTVVEPHAGCRSRARATMSSYRCDVTGQVSTRLTRLRDVAQLGSASALGAEGRRFKSCHPDLSQHAPERTSNGRVTFTLDWRVGSAGPAAMAV